MAIWIKVSLDIPDTREEIYGPFKTSTEAELALEKQGWVNNELKVWLPLLGEYTYSAIILSLNARPREGLAVRHLLGASRE